MSFLLILSIIFTIFLGHLSTGPDNDNNNNNNNNNNNFCETQIFEYPETWGHKSTIVWRTIFARGWQVLKCDVAATCRIPKRLGARRGLATQLAEAPSCC